MSSRILDPDTPTDPVPWAPGGGSGGEQARVKAQPGALPQTAHDPGDHPKIRELEGSMKLLERRIEEEKKAARDQGHQQGLAAGAQQEAAKWSEALSRLARSIEEMSKSKARFRAEVEEDAVKLALAIARKVLNRELASDPEALAGLARVALDKLNVRELQRVRVHPTDAPAIDRLLTASSGPKRVEVIGDKTLERGAAIFETERGTLDASVTTQLSEIERGLADMLGGPSK
jgi:flagellar assembly protein FliH